ncbi:MAG TPA: hypothetical protein VKT76_17265, partial [Bradyrhizobium sp.]|nr:hypothetical protein [Bradyrhizobium sp.]
KFATDCAMLGIERLWPAVQDISKAHISLGLADPTLSGAVATAISDVAGIMPPRSWPENRKARFKSLPYDVQAFIAEHETRREKALRRVQNEVAILRRKLATAQSSKPQTKTEIKDDEVERKADGQSPA